MSSAAKHVAPFAVAALRRRAYNAKSPKERHDTAYFAWEASIRIAVAARPPADRSKLVMPSIGSFVSALDLVDNGTAARDMRLDAPEILALASLFSEVVHGKKDGSKSTTPSKLLAGLPAYRNVVLGHGSTRPTSFYDDASTRFVDALEVAWRAGIFLPLETKVVYADTVEIDKEGGRVARLIDLSAEAPLVLDPRGSNVPDHVTPGALHARAISKDGEVTYTSLHPWLLYRETDLREQMLFFNGRAKGANYLDYVGGETLKGKPLIEAFPSIEEDVRMMLQTVGPPSSPTLDAGPKSSASEEKPDQFGDYTLLGKLGEGGMGVVYLARQESLGRLVALKMLSQETSSDPVAVARFRREIKALASCEHGSIVKILASGKRRDTHYYAMELIEGADLSEIAGALASAPTLDAAITQASKGVRKAKVASGVGGGGVADADAKDEIPPVMSHEVSVGAEASEERTRKLARFFRDAALAIQSLHEAGILHRDLKPSNLMVTAVDHRLVVMDLGLAAASNATRSITKDKSSLLGTLRYMPPEQLQRNLLELDARADVYALGATFYELCIGRPFLEGETEAQLITQVLHGTPIPPRKANPKLPIDLGKILEKATQKDRTQRYADARALAQDIDAFLAGRPVSARAATPLYRAKLAVQRNKVSAAVIGLIVIAGLAVGTSAVRSATKPHACAIGDAADCNKQCTRGDGASCYTLGLMYQQGSGVPGDLSLAASSFKLACERGHAQACHEHAKALEVGGGVAVSFDEARAQYERACTLGSPQGCSDLAVMLAHGRGGPLDTARAITLFDKACNDGFPNACSNLGVHYEKGEGVAKDEARARGLYDKACTAGSSPACAVLAITLAEGRGGPKDEPRAASLYDKACTAGDRHACYGLGAMLEEGRGIPRDQARAAAKYQGACLQRVARACVSLGRLIAEGTGIPKNERRAVQLFEEACEAEEPIGCRLAGEAFERGTGVASDLANAASLFERGCKANDAPSCVDLALLLSAGKGVPKDAKRANELLAQGCEAGDQRACIAREGKTPPPAPTRVGPVPFRGCKCNPGDPLCSCL